MSHHDKTKARLPKVTKSQMSLCAMLLLSACGSGPTRLTGESQQTRDAIAAHRLCAGRNLEALIADQIPGTLMERAVAAEKPCVQEREGLRNALEMENRPAMEGDRHSRIMVASFADASIRFSQERLLRDLVFAQTQVKEPVDITLTGIQCSAVQPIFPKSIARDQSVSTALATAKFDVLPNGAVSSVVVTRSSGYRELDASVYDALSAMTCVARPDVSEKVTAKQHFVFKLE